MVSIDNYKDLKDAVQQWLNRRDPATVNNIPMFINFAEKQFTRLVKLPYYETGVEFTIDEQFNYVVIPQDFLSAKHVMVNGKPYNRVDVETFMRMKNIDRPSDQKSDSTSANTSQAFVNGGTLSRNYFFCRIGEQLHFLPTRVIGDVVEIIYSQDIPEMTFDNDQPYSLLIAPDVLLYLSLRHASIFLRDNDQEQYWMAKAQEAADSMNKQLEEAEWAGSALVVPFFDE